jgi:hypothetical protein
MTSYLGPGLWQRSASGGYQWQATTMGTLSVDLAYVSSNTLAAVSSYHGTYFDCVYSVHLRHGVTVLYSYRGAVSSAGGTSVSRNVAQFSLVWSSNVGQLFQ